MGCSWMRRCGMVWSPTCGPTTAASFPGCRLVLTAGRCAPTPICPSPPWCDWSPNSWSRQASTTSHSSQTPWAAQLLVSEGRDQRVGRMVITSSEAFDNYPPGLPGRTIALALKVPGALYGALLSLRVRSIRRLPFTYGWMAKRLPDRLVDAWLEPALSHGAIR